VPGRGCDTESATLADLDGDGNIDIAGAQGGHPDLAFDGDEPGIRVIWGPAKESVNDPAAWTDAGRFPQTIEQGHYLDLTPFDVNRDGATDLMIGGRVYFGNGARSGIGWLEAPSDTARRRDLAAWQLHAIDPETTGGHGFVLTDLNGDRRPDLVDANADFDTPEDQEAISWYEGPDPRGSAITQPWKRHTLLRSDRFYGKPQIVATDLNRDGRTDLVSQTQDEYLLFERKPGRRVEFTLVSVRKPAIISGPSRGLAVGDMNRDGKPDIVGMLTHDDGILPAGKASVYWLSANRSRGEPISARWRVHVIKWSAGRTMAVGLLGEKWDQVRLRDVNRDGYPDIVANDEEWYQQPGVELAFWNARPPGGESVAVVWFENPIGERPSTCRIRNGRCAIEAERPDQARDGTWIERNQVTGATGGAYLQAFIGMNPRECPATPRPRESAADCPLRADGALLPSDTDGVDYRLSAPAGMYDIWVRAYSPSQFGNEMGAERSNSVWVAVDHGSPAAVGEAALPPDAWTWVKAVDAVELTRRSHAVTLKVRERGSAIDKFLVQRAGSAGPTS
jgi:hypothetical protein